MPRIALFISLNLLFNFFCDIRGNDTDDAKLAKCLQLIEQVQTAREKQTKLEQQLAKLDKEHIQLSLELEQMRKKKQSKNFRSTGSGITTWINCCTSWVKDHLYPDSPELIALRQENTALQQKNAELKQLKAALQQEHTQQQEKNATLEKQLTKARPTLLDPPE